jgi:hypothetical protein
MFDMEYSAVPELEIVSSEELCRNVALFAVSLRVTYRETIELNGGGRRLDY